VGATGPQGPVGPEGPQGPPGPAGEVVTDDSMYAANTTGATIAVVLGGTQIPLPSLQNLDGFTANGANTGFTVTETGRYFITYSIDLTAGVLVGSSVTVNGVSVPASQISPILGTEYSTSFIVNLTAGDVIALQLEGLLGAAILSTGAGTALTVIRLS
jgi:hypothetical protein